MKTIIAIPGLGGHKSVFGHYAASLSEYTFEFVEVINLHKGEQELGQAISSSEKAIILANCYGALPALRKIKDSANRIESLIIIEPFFAEFYWWRSVALMITKKLLMVSRFTDKIGLRRHRYAKEIDYALLSRYPLWMQPFFDLSYQSTTDYLEKIQDIISFKLPECITIPTLFIFSPGGYSQNPARRAQIISHFSSASIVEAGTRTHNIVTVSEEEISQSIKNWLQS